MPSELRMRVAAFPFVCLVLLLAAAGCRQGDAPLPAPQGDEPNRLEDISRDLENVAGGEQDAQVDLADDLAVFAKNEAQEAQIRELARQVASSVAGSNLNGQSGKQLANHLWVTVSAPDLSEHQIEALKNDVQAAMQAIGASDQSAQRIAAQVGEVQKVVTTRTRRWYELF